LIARKTPLRRRKRIIVKRSTLKNKCDRLFSMRVRAAGVCARCGETRNLQCSHFISRRYLGVRYNLLNAECLCIWCHKFLTDRPLEACDRAIEQLGEAVYQELRRLALAFTGPLDYRLIADALR
jgi:hypothetical protein